MVDDSLLKVKSHAFFFKVFVTMTYMTQLLLSKECGCRHLLSHIFLGLLKDGKLPVNFGNIPDILETFHDFFWNIPEIFPLLCNPMFF